MLHEKLTESDVKKIQEEIEHRKLVIRKEALESVKEARAHGDLSENFEYKAAKQYKNKNESRIRYLEKMLKNAEIIEDHAGSDEVGLNKVVKIYIPEDEEEEEYKIVTSIRGSSINGYISIESPLGKALLGHKVGDTVYVSGKSAAKIKVGDKVTVCGVGNSQANGGGNASKVFSNKKMVVVGIREGAKYPYACSTVLTTVGLGSTTAWFSSSSIS